MPRKRTYGVNWEPYRSEIIELYVKENKTAKATIQHLLERHGLQVTYVLITAGLLLGRRQIC